MSTRTLFEELYFDQQREMTHLRDQKADLQIKLIQCESQRSSLIFLILSTARSLEENHFPQLADMLRKQVAQMEQDYARSQSVDSSAVPGGPANEAGSRAVPEVAKELESPEGVPVSHTGSVAYIGNWDD